LRYKGFDEGFVSLMTGEEALLLVPTDIPPGPAGRYLPAENNPGHGRRFQLRFPPLQSSPMTRTDLVARLVRLEQLYLSLAKERRLMRDAMYANGCPMLRAEWLEYDRAITATIAGIETARVTLAKVTERLIEG
jgi:hypothetical protein